MKTKTQCHSRMFFILYKFRHIEHNKTTLGTHFSNLSLVHVRNLLMTQQNGAVSNFVAQTALVHHLSSEIRISYLYTCYIKIQFVSSKSHVWNSYLVDYDVETLSGFLLLNISHPRYNVHFIFNVIEVF